ncbi:MAG: DUF58 domain-containing protein [Planctomycetes bacterium]|nr:DUF58 domain-containing protein [Planctomycetota bacterium]
MPSNAADYLNPDVLQQVARLDLKAKFVVEGFFAGLHRSPFHGFSVEFSEHRKYTLGDEIKMIDWSVYAKTDKLYVRKFQAETNLECFLLVDMSESMAYRHQPRGLSKMDYATCLAAAMGYLLIQQQDPVGLITFDTALRNYLPARSKRGHLVSILGELSRNKPGGRTRLHASLAQAAELLRHRGLVVLFSDLLDDPESVLEGLHLLRFRQHEVIVFHILDRAETEFPFQGMTLFQDVETAERVQVDPESVREAYRAHMEAFLERYRRACERASIDYVQMTTSTPFDSALLEFLVRRERKC